jgi:hypothetical protein
MQLIVDPDTGGVDLEEYARNRIEAALGALQGAEVLKEGEKRLENGRNVYECVFKWIPSDDKIIFRKTVFMIIDGAGYTFGANFSKKTLKTIGVEMERMIESFQPGAAIEDEE